MGRLHGPSTVPGVQEAPQMLAEVWCSSVPLLPRVVSKGLARPRGSWGQRSKTEEIRTCLTCREGPQVQQVKASPLGSRVQPQDPRSATHADTHIYTYVYSHTLGDTHTCTHRHK